VNEKPFENRGGINGLRRRKRLFCWRNNRLSSISVPIDGSHKNRTIMNESNRYPKKEEEEMKIWK